MNTPNNTPLRERSLAFLIRAADQLVRAERADILASEGIRRHDLRALRRLAGTDASSNGETVPRGEAEDTSLGDAAAADTAATRTHHGHPRRGHRGRARFGGFPLRHLLMRGWISFSDGRATITAEGRSALIRIDERLAASRTRIESVLTPEQLATTTDALTSIVEELGGAERLRDVRRRRHLMRHLREGGPGHGFGHRGFPSGYGVDPAYAGVGGQSGFRHGFGPRHGFGLDGFGHDGFDRHPHRPDMPADCRPAGAHAHGRPAHESYEHGFGRGRRAHEGRGRNTSSDD